MNPVWYQARASASLRHQPVCLLGHAPCVNRQRSRPRSISRPPAARQRLPHYLGHSICSDWQLSRPPSIGRLRRAPIRPLWAPRRRSRNAKRGAQRVAQAARKVRVFSDSGNDNGPPATFHAVQEAQSSCQGKKPCHADRISFLAHVLKSQVNRSRIYLPNPAAPVLLRAAGSGFVFGIQKHNQKSKEVSCGRSR